MVEATARDPKADERRLLEAVRGLVAELGGRPGAVSPSSHLERELGLGSLERTELVTRVERAFGVTLPDRALVDLDTPKALLAAVRSVQSAGGAATATYRAELADDDEAASARAASWHVPEDVHTLVDAIRYRAEVDGDAPHIHLLADDLSTTPLSYRGLWEGALRVAGGLATLGLQRGDRVALILPTSLGFFEAFVGIQAASCVPVPIYPPIRMDQLNSYLERHARILSNAGVSAVVTDDTLKPVAGLIRDRVPGLRHVATIPDLDAGVGFGAARIEPDDLGLIQYTSGSTGDPKGVALRHRNLIANMRANGKGLRLGPTDVCVSWLPLYHDMGLIGSWMTAHLHATPLYLLSPLQFLSRPERWLWAFHRYRGSIAPAPNFGYELCTRKVPDEALEGLDLSTWRVAMNGSEPVRAETLERFIARFGPCGFRREAMFPVYGLAESCVGVAFPTPGDPPRYEVVEKERFLHSRRAEPTDKPRGAGGTMTFVACGHALEEHEVRIAEPDGRGLDAIGERCEGRVLFRGPSTMEGYFRREDATRETLREDGWVETGDLGYMAGGELFITGRVKDLVIKGGRKYHPQDIEQAAWKVEGVRKGCVVAFAVPSAQSGEEIVVLVETRAEKDAHERIRREVTERVLEAVGTPADRVVLLAPGTIPKTSSGKLRRRESRTQFLAGDLSAPTRAPAREILKVALGSIGPRVRRLARAGLRRLYAGYATSVAYSGLVLGLIIVGACPGDRLAFRVARAWLRGLFVLLGAPVRRVGGALPEGRAIVVSNHASYIDPLVLIAGSERPLVFTAKAPAFRWPLIGRVLRRLGAIPVVRTSGQSFLESYEDAAKGLDEGALLHVFPEGTFTRATGVRPFRLGAFRLAAEKRVPILPVALAGTRHMLREGRRTIWWSRLRVEVLPPVAPPDDPEDFRAVSRQRDEVREALARVADEPLLDLSSAALPEGVTE